MTEQVKDASSRLGISLLQAAAPLVPRSPADLPGGPRRLVARDVEIDRVKGALADPASYGVLVTGDVGQGKTAIVRQAVATLPVAAEVLHIRGSSTAAGTPLGALTVLLVDLDEEVVRNPLLLLTALQGLFARMASGRPVVVVDGVEDLDAESATVLAHLASARALKLVIITAQTQRMPDPFLELWRNHKLERIDIEPLTLHQAEELLGQVLNGPVSRLLAVSLWRDANGNAGNLGAVIPPALESGYVAQVDGVWTLRRSFLEDGIPVPAGYPDMLGDVPDSARTAIFLLSVFGALPLRVLLRYAPANELTGLQRDGVIRMQFDSGSSVAVLGDPVASTRLRAALALAPEAGVMEAIEELGRADEVPPASDVLSAAWLVHAGGSLTDERLLRSARHANDLLMHSVARRFLLTLDDWQEQPAAVVEFVRMASDGPEAHTALVAVRRHLADQRVPLVVRAKLRLAGAKLRMRYAIDLEDLPAELRDGWADCSAVEGDEGEETRAELSLLGLEVAVIEGRYRDAISGSPMLLPSLVLASSTAVRAKGLLVFALAATGQDKAAAVVAEALALSTRHSSSGDRWVTHRAGVLASAVAGRLEEALGLLRAASSLGCPIQDEGWAETVEGMLLAGSGRSREALPLLLAGMAQLKVEDRSAVLPATEAAAAYAYALDGQDELARACLARVDSADAHRGRSSRQIAEFFSVLATSLLDGSARAAQETLRWADRQRDLGNDGLELLLLTQAVRLGEYSAAHRLSILAAAQDSPLAGVGFLLSRGVLAQSAAILLEAAEAALAVGHHDLAGSAALLTVDLREDDDDPLIFVRAEQILRRTSVERRRSRTRKALTERERAVARMVARGASNKDIAAAEHLSVRTAEGYVHRVMTKLGVNNRKQLRSVFTNP
ncbi:hypothetical protein GM708_10325 [Vibrio cholerae]|nr:hypothetical protein [Vibrio cholerae]